MKYLVETLRSHGGWDEISVNQILCAAPFMVLRMKYCFNLIEALRTTGLITENESILACHYAKLEFGVAGSA